MPLQHIKTLKGTIKLMTGLHIGGSKEAIEIGGIDNPVIRNPLNNEPYIPGSSLKGKIRCLLEWELNRPGICKCGQADCKICRIFGCGDAEKTTEPTRIIFRDCSLTSSWSEKFQEGTFILENKTEVTIDRLKGKVATAGPRTMERVPAGVTFDFVVDYRCFNPEQELEDLDFLRQGLRHLEKDALGGSGSRGYGRIKFHKLTYDGQDFPLE